MDQPPNKSSFRQVHNLPSEIEEYRLQLGINSRQSEVEAKATSYIYKHVTINTAETITKTN